MFNDISLLMINIWPFCTKILGVIRSVHPKKFYCIFSLFSQFQAFLSKNIFFWKYWYQALTMYHYVIRSVRTHKRYDNQLTQSDNVHYFSFSFNLNEQTCTLYLEPVGRIEEGISNLSRFDIYLPNIHTRNPWICPTRKKWFNFEIIMILTKKWNWKNSCACPLSCYPAPRT